MTNFNTIIAAAILAIGLVVAAVSLPDGGLGASNYVPGVNLFPTTQFTEGGGATTIDPIDAAYTLTASDMATFNYLTFEASSTQPALTVTLPATTSFPLAADAGATRTWILENPFTAAATTTTIAAGTGVDLQEPNDGSSHDVVININGYAYIDCTRQPTTDIICVVNEVSPAD